MKKITLSLLFLLGSFSPLFSLEFDYHAGAKVAFYLTTFTDGLFKDVNADLAGNLPDPRAGLGQKREFTFGLGGFAGVGLGFLEKGDFPMAVGVGYSFTWISSKADFEGVSQYEGAGGFLPPFFPPVDPKDNSLTTKETFEIPVHTIDLYYTVQLNKPAFQRIPISLQVSMGMALASPQKLAMESYYVDNLDPTKNDSSSYKRSDQALSLGFHTNIRMNFHAFFVGIDYLIFPALESGEGNPLYMSEGELKSYRSLNSQTTHNFSLDLGIMLNTHLIKTFFE